MEVSLSELDLFGRETVNQNAYEIERLSCERPLDHFRYTFKLLSEARYHDPSKILRAFKMAKAHPMASHFQPSIAALALIQHCMGKPVDPVEAMLFPSNAPMGYIGKGRLDDRLLPLDAARQMVEIWDELSRVENRLELQEKARLAKEWMRRFHEPFPTLFCKERDFSEGVNNLSPSSSSIDEHLGVANHPNACLTLSGWNSGLGYCRLSTVEIQTFGPQKPPLSELSHFGIAQVSPEQAEMTASENGLMVNGWTRCFANRDVWLSIRSVVDENGLQINARFVGLPPKMRYSMAFYITASSCRLEDGTVIMPKSMQRNEGLAQKIILDDHVELESSEKIMMQIIPLAGFGCFWNANYLIAFEVNSSQCSSFFSLKIAK